MILEKLSLSTLKNYVDNEYKNDSKKNIIKLLNDRIEKNSELKQKIYQDNIKSFALKPTEVENILNISRVERKKLEDMNILKKVGTQSVRKFGKIIDYSIYDKIHTENIRLETIEKARESWKKTAKINREIAQKKARKTKEENRKKINNVIELLKLDLEKVKTIDENLYLYYELAFWTMWISRWAKENQKKQKASLKRSTENKYLEESKRLYSLKLKAIEILFKSNFFKLYFYKSETSDKYSFEFCKEHFSNWREERFYSDTYISIFEYFLNNKKEISSCPNCSVDVEKDYYSLYFIDIFNENIKDLSFSFHIPYPLAKDFLPDENSLSKIQHIENEDSVFRFGRGIEDEEYVLYKQKFVEKKFKEILEKIQAEK